MNELFNTSFEIGLRAMLILSIDRSNGMTIDRISAYDFIIIYGKAFEVSKQNLHGNNSFSFSELSTKRALCSEGVKQLVLDGLITVIRTSGGFLYRLTTKGRILIDLLESDYKEQYLEIAKETRDKYDLKSDFSVLKEINEKAIQALRRQ